MPLQLPGGAANAAIHFIGGAGSPEYVTTIGVNVGNLEFPAVAQANRVFDAAAAHIANFVASDCTLEKVSLSFGPVPGGGSIQSDRVAVPCTGGSRDFPVAGSYVVQKRTDGIGRKHRGRMFVPCCLDHTHVDANGNLKPALRLSMQQHMDDFMAALTATDSGGGSSPVEPVLLHSGNDSPDPITALVVSSRIGWVRGRL